MKRLLPALRLLLLVATAACGSNRSAPLPDTSAPLSLLALPTLAGPTFDPAALQGKLVVVNFWSPG